MDTVQAIWTAGLASGKKISIDNYKNSLTEQELFLVRERQTERIFSVTLLSTDLSYLRQFSPVCLYDNWTDESELYSINKHLVNNAQMPLSNIKWFIRAR